MKLTVGQLKRILVEALAPAPEQRAQSIVDATADAAEQFVDSLVAGDVDKEAADKLKQLADQSASIAKWMQTNRNPKAPALVRFAQQAQDLSKDVGFWSRPMFFKREEYVEKMKTKVKRLQNAHVALVSH